MAHGLIRWTAWLVLAGALIALPLVPPGRIVRQAEGPLRSFATAMGWTAPTDMDAERAFREAGQERIAARAAYRTAVWMDFSWRLADAVADRAAAVQRSGAPILFETLDPVEVGLGVEEASAGPSDCEVGDLELGTPVKDDLAGATCQADGAPSVRYRFDLPERSPFVATVSSPAVRPRLRLDGAALGRSVYGVARSTNESITALVLEAGVYEIEVFVEGGDVPGESTLLAEVPDGAPLPPGSALLPGDDLSPSYRLDLESGREYAVRLAPGMSLLNGSGLHEGPGVLVVSGNGPQLVLARSPGGAGPVVEVSEALVRSGTRLDFEQPIAWTPDATGIGTFALDLTEPMAVEVRVRSGDGSMAIPARSWVVGASGVQPVERERPLTPGSYGIVVALDDPASASGGEALALDVRCAAGVVSADLEVPMRWAGAPACDPERGAATAWQIELDEPRVISAEWGEGGRAGVVRNDAEGWWGALRSGSQLEAGRYYVLGEGTAARAIVVRDLGSPEERLRTIVEGAVDSIGGAAGSAALTGFVFSPYRPEASLRWSGVPVVTGSVDGRPFCAAIRFGTPMTWRSWETPELGLCALYARFGAPGGAVDAWIARGGAAFGGSSRPASEQDLWWSGELEDRGPLGMIPIGPYVGLDVATEACLEGIEARCDELWNADLDAASAASPIRGLVDYERDVPLYGVAEFVLATLRAEFGDEAFGRFWTSDLPPEGAFASAFGTSPGAWTRTYAIVTLGPRTGRGSAWVDALFALLLVAFMAAIAVRSSTRRSVP